MKVILLFFLILISLQPTLAQELKICGYQGYQTVEEVTSACDLQGATASTKSSKDAEIVVDNILDKVGLFRNFLIEECDNINNALAVTMPLEGGDIDRYILYDEAFFQKVSASTGTDWGLTSILAHEVGHHLNGHTLKGGGSNHKVELQADEFSGFVLARMGCSLADAQSAVSKLLPDGASATHPAKVDRLGAIEIGWNRGNGKTIVVKKIEDVEDPSEITAEQVIANYLDAIGGQEKIMEIKTLSTNVTMTLKKKKSKFDTKTNIEYLYASPIKYIKKVNVHVISVYSLFLNNKFYQKWALDSPWVLNPETNISVNEEKSVSYIPEFEALTNNLDIKYLGLKKINGKECYVIEYPNFELMRNESGVMHLQNTKFYEVVTGLLYYEELIVNKNSVNGSIKTSSKAIYSDYRPVNGVLFSFKQDMTMLTSVGGVETPSTTVVEYSEIKINPSIDPALFDPNN